MESLHIVHHLRIKVEKDQEALQRVVAKLVRPLLERIDDRLVFAKEPLEQLASHVVLVAEMVEEAALGDTCGFDQLFDRSRREALLDNRFIGNIEDPLAGLLTLGLGTAFQLYRRSSFLHQPIDHYHPALAQSKCKLHENKRNLHRSGKPTARSLVTPPPRL